ncbi:phage portal protein [Sulfurovum mangrovi]|uniref:phage portal protein n=1 Tax=Sulfurovum mangrovi TaxID=2893889 RepID=UPI001E4A2D1B|nr:phage portal protein [Sulfurovum mangrovi]UFH59828.1 phage portal protein [Sulfurovum mangrovi]UFH59879.1 phage portal protein [Sulfurovum mangrovi]
MNLGNLFASRSSVPLSSPEAASIFSSLFTISKSGITVTQDTAMRHAAVFACYIVLSEGVASLPLHIMKKTIKNGRTIKKKATDHHLYNVLRLMPNNEMTSFAWMQASMMNIVSRGNGYSQIIKDGRDRVIGFYPLLSDNMESYRSESGDLGFVYNSSKYGRVFLEKDEVLNIPGHTLDGVTGINPIQVVGNNSIGLSVALEEHGSNFFKNGANATGAFKTPDTLSDEAFKRLKNDLGKNYTGLMNSGKPMILEGGLDFSKFSVSNNDSQFLESRKYQKEEIASIFRVPMHMINALENATFSNIEHQSLDFVINTLRPWVLRIEQALNIALFGGDTTYFVKFNMAAMLRGDTKSRYEAYGMAIRDGWLTRNEVREMEDLNELDGLDEPLLPMNMTEGGTNAKED